MATQNGTSTPSSSYGSDKKTKFPSPPSTSKYPSSTSSLDKSYDDIDLDSKSASPSTGTSLTSSASSRFDTSIDKDSSFDKTKEHNADKDRSGKSEMSTEIKGEMDDAYSMVGDVMKVMPAKLDKAKDATFRLMSNRWVGIVGAAAIGFGAAMMIKKMRKTVN